MTYREKTIADSKVGLSVFSPLRQTLLPVESIRPIPTIMKRAVGISRLSGAISTLLYLHISKSTSLPDKGGYVLFIFLTINIPL